MQTKISRIPLYRVLSYLHRGSFAITHTVPLERINIFWNYLNLNYTLRQTTTSYILVYAGVYCIIPAFNLYLSRKHVYIDFCIEKANRREVKIWNLKFESSLTFVSLICLRWFISNPSCLEIKTKKILFSGLLKYAKSGYSVTF